MSNKTICIYHGNCADGFGAAWVVRRALGGAINFYPGVYQDPPPDVAGRDVIVVDFSYKRPVLLEMAKTAASINIFDHHKTAAEDLLNIKHEAACPVGVIFDVERSGAKITWDWFFPHEPAPQLLLHIQDRDLWQFKLPLTREIQAAVFSYPYDFEVWDKLMKMDTAALAEEGKAIERKHFKDIDELVEVVTKRMSIGGYDVPVANLPYTLTSDAGHKLASGEPFAGCFWFTPQGWVFSLRSHDTGLDVSEIAKQYGGGGHKHAAGFRVPLDKLGDFFKGA
jgi:uncharacterized protein